ncbi:hypothetical protein [Rickettsia felis]|uniref:hypothetical protein n=1 Tax=Rickettsia felis TaxID=42862 RepID=UPI001584CA6B|nr:hypothetical protein [Rickettsia felis]
MDRFFRHCERTLVSVAISGILPKIAYVQFTIVNFLAMTLTIKPKPISNNPK